MSCKLIVCGLLGLAIIVSSSAPLADVTPIDLSGWTALTLDLPGGQSAGNWNLSGMNTTVTQTINADPSFYLNNEDQTNYEINGTWLVNQSDDDDFIGFVFGYRDPGHTYIFDWKQAYQNEPGYGTAQEGFRISRIDAPDVSLLGVADFWSEFDTPYKTILASQYGSGQGWVDFTSYKFALTFEPGSFTVRVTQDQAILWEVTVSDAAYPSGQFGFYNFSQANVQYSGFVQNDFPLCDAGGPYFGNAGEPVQFDGTASFDPDGDIVLYEWTFGDGTIGSGPAPVHTYSTDGEYVIGLCVTDNVGARECCESASPAISTESMSWGATKANFR